MKNLKDLRIYKLSIEIGELIWKEVQKWDNFEKWTIGKQLVESADSISVNIMEGYYRNQKGDMRKFFQYALASAKESELWTWKSHNREIMRDELYKEIQVKYDDLLPQLVNFIKSIS